MTSSCITALGNSLPSLCLENNKHIQSAADADKQISFYFSQTPPVWVIYYIW